MEGLRDGLRRASLPIDDFDDDRVAEVLQRLALATEGGSSTPCGPVFQQFGHGGDPAAMAYFKNRTSLVRGYFPGALGCEDFLNRMEIALSRYGFNGDNSIAMTNLCRDEITSIFRQKIDDIFGMNFSTNGLGGVMTCGRTGLKAGISHAPICSTTGRSNYVFFAFPHIAISATGDVGKIGRPGQVETNSACGALIGAMSKIKSDGVAECAHVAGEHDADDPEMSILMHRLARRLKAEGGVGKEDEITLPSITKVAQEVMTSDLEHLINLVVDPSEADYAVVTGIQVHSWGDSYHDLHPNLEYVQPCSLYVVNQGKRTDIDIQTIAGPTPRQLRLLNAPQLKRSEIDLSIRPDSPHVHTMTRRRESASRTSSFSRAFRV
mmetsp:Transcript_65297/g.206259  ORF Transcript_65297/g.206259 Transcript_65297/m.206259 type:complete len:379 (-) Transcript_65297:323-1459(-)